MVFSPTEWTVDWIGFWKMDPRTSLSQCRGWNEKNEDEAMQLVIGWVFRASVTGALPFDAHGCHIDTAIKLFVPDRIKPSFVIFDIRALWRSGLSVKVPGCQKFKRKWRLNPVWHKRLYSCIHIATVGVKGLILSLWSDLRIRVTWWNLEAAVTLQAAQPAVRTPQPCSNLCLLMSRYDVHLTTKITFCR